jgi:hypothetical protein
MLSAITGVLAALPEILKLLASFGAWLKHVSGGDPQGYILKAAQAFDQLQSAKSPEEKTASAKAIQDLIRGQG